MTTATSNLAFIYTQDFESDSDSDDIIQQQAELALAKFGDLSIAKKSGEPRGKQPIRRFDSADYFMDVEDAKELEKKLEA